MTSEGFAKMFEGDFGEICSQKFPLTALGGRAKVSSVSAGSEGEGSHSLLNCVTIKGLKINTYKYMILAYIIPSP